MGKLKRQNRAALPMDYVNGFFFNIQPEIRAGVPACFLCGLGGHCVDQDRFCDLCRFCVPV
jgi:hypothetical protein